VCNPAEALAPVGMEVVAALHLRLFLLQEVLLTLSQLVLVEMLLTARTALPVLAVLAVLAVLLLLVI